MHEEKERGSSALEDNPITGIDALEVGWLKSFAPFSIVSNGFAGTKLIDHQINQECGPRRDGA